MNDHDHLTALLGRLKLTALRDQLDSLIDEAGRRELTIREALTLFCEREVARRDQRRIQHSRSIRAVHLSMNRSIRMIDRNLSV